MFTRIKTTQEIAAMRSSGKLLALVLKLVSARVAPGMSTKELAVIAAQELKALGGKPAFLGYQGFPDVLCISVNDEVVHGIPRSDRILDSGDIVGLDLGVTYDGMITDSAVTVIVGEPLNAAHSRLLTVTKKSLYTGIDVVKAGVRVGTIAQAIQAVLDIAKLGIVRDLVGHGVGHEIHEDPNIPNYGTAGTGPTLRAGMTIAIEPMATLGGDAITIAKDGWTVVTADHSLAAHFEHTVLITEDGVEILTAL